MSRDDFSLGLFTDLYQLTMAQAYWHSGKTAPATFSLYFRNYPPDRAYFVFAGLPDIVAYLEELQFRDADIKFLRSLNRFDTDFLDYLSRLRFTGNVRAMPEGSILFINEPVVEVTVPIIEAQIVETYLINQINLQSVLATKAARVVHAARGKTVVDFAARRTHGTEAANKLARAGYIVGFAGTSNVLAGALYDIPAFGTMAHSFITAFDHEIDSFRAYAESFPDSSSFLVDTYDTLTGTRHAAEVAREMRESGHALRAIRLDSGDLLGLSLKARSELDQSELGGVQIFASGGLDEFEIEALLDAGATIDGFGVGTKVGVSADAPWTDCVYKLVEYDGRPTLKLSSQRQTLPSPKQVYRFYDGARNYLHDVIARAAENMSEAGSEPLLEEVMRDGERLVSLPSLNEVREHFRVQFSHLPEEHKALRSPMHYRVTTSEELEELRSRVSRQVMERELGTASPEESL